MSLVELFKQWLETEAGKAAKEAHKVVGAVEDGAAKVAEVVAAFIESPSLSRTLETFVNNHSSFTFEDLQADESFSDFSERDVLAHLSKMVSQKRLESTDSGWRS